ncbi:MAG: hypothetical protein ABIG65_02400, partial [Patescibacteria group bacterium]
MKLNIPKKPLLVSAIVISAVLMISAGLFWHFGRSGAKPAEKENNIAFVLPDKIVLADESIPLIWTDN